MTSEQLLFLAFGLLVAGAAISLLGRDWRKSGYAGTAFMALACLSLWILALRAITSGVADIPAGLSLLVPRASLGFHIDRLSAVFLMVVPFVGLATMLYSIEYMAKMHPTQSPRRYYPFAMLLMASIVGVITSADLFFFFIFWELMTLTSWALVWFDRDDEMKVKAAWQYFVATHVAAACMLIAILVIYANVGSFAFADVAKGIGAMHLPLVHLLAALFLIAFATKAGMFPFGGWLPQAYPAAPSPASAAFAGSMTKLGIYGIVRVFYLFFGAPELTAVWGGIIAALGGISIFVGTLTALREDDSKRILSFHIIGQIGYMLAAIGTGIFFIHSNPALATIALIAGLYHVVNHACYKSLLFLNVGSAEYWTGTRDLNKMGGLGKLMPVTLVAIIIASLSIAGIPPFSGFVSKWLIYQSTIQGGLSMPPFLLLGLIAVFISIVTLASFMKVIGSMFLGNPAKTTEAAGEVPVAMRIPQIALSAVCVLLGIAPILPLIMLYGAAKDTLGSVPGFASLFGASASGITLYIGERSVGVWNPAVMAIGLAVCALIAYVILKSGHAPSRETASWYGGEEYTTDQVRYRAHGFVLPFKNAFVRVYPSFRLPSFKMGFLKKLIDFDGWLYNPLVKSGSRLTDRISRSHSGLPAMYMLWQLVGVVLVLVILFVWR
jgi:hydrogenase-4 component B